MCLGVENVNSRNTKNHLPYTHTHTHTHTQREREREREQKLFIILDGSVSHTNN